MVNLNRLNERSRATQGSGRPVLKQNAWKESTYLGSVLSGGLKRGDNIFVGDFGYYDYKTRKSYHLRQFVLAKDLLATDTEVYFLNTDYTHYMRSDLFLMAEPKTENATGKGVACTSLETTTLEGVSVYKLTIEANALGTGTKYDIYVEAKAAGTDVAPMVGKVNVIFDDGLFVKTDLADVRGETYNDVATITPLMHCTVIADLVIVPKIAPANKCAVEEFYQL